MRHWGVAFGAVLAAGCSCAAPRGRADGGAGDAALAMDARALDAFAPDAFTPDGPTSDPLLSDARGPDASSPDGALPDAATSDAGGGCVIGTSRDCVLMCMSGGTAPGRQRCLGGDAWAPCERPTELCGNGLDDDGDSLIDEDCTAVGGCIWIRPQCQGVMTMNAWCASAGGRHLVSGRRCPVAGGDQVLLDAAYGAFPLCCCDVASMCVPVCEDSSCASCVVWDEIECCL